ncbi:hypothetical protein GCM10022209_44830 [Chitinophaga oryziterrae]
MVTSCIHHSPAVDVAKSTIIAVNRSHPDSSKIIREDDSILSEFIPENYTILDTISGDLNLDQYPDMIIVLKKMNEAEISFDGYRLPYTLICTAT